MKIIQQIISLISLLNERIHSISLLSREEIDNKCDLNYAGETSVHIDLKNGEISNPFQTRTLADIVSISWKNISGNFSSGVGSINGLNTNGKSYIIDPIYLSNLKDKYENKYRKKFIKDIIHNYFSDELGDSNYCEVDDLERYWNEAHFRNDNDSIEGFLRYILSKDEIEAEIKYYCRKAYEKACRIIVKISVTNTFSYNNDYIHSFISRFHNNKLGEDFRLINSFLTERIDLINLKFMTCNKIFLENNYARRLSLY
jgi:hypothetical protein